MAGVIFRILEDETCPSCGSGLYERHACKSLEDEGFETMLKCVTAGCGYMRGLKREIDANV